MGAHDGFTGTGDAGAGLELQLVGYQQQQERSLQQVDAEIEGHELEARVVLEYSANSLGRGDGVAGGGDEAGRADPQVVVVQQADGVPFSDQEDVQDVHDMCAIGGDDGGLDVELGHAG